MTGPNLLIFMCDQMQKQAMKEAITPNFDRLRQDGVLFDKAYTVNAVCSPARASLMTGLLPHNHGVLTVTHTMEKDQCRIREQYPHFAMSLQNKGYKTGYFGKWHVDHDEKPERFGWEVTSKTLRSSSTQKQKNQYEWATIRRYDSDAGYKDNIFYAVCKSDQSDVNMDYITNDALCFIEQHKENPWACFLSFSQPHDPYICSEKYFRMYDRVDLEIPSHWYDDLEGRPNVYKRVARVWDEFSMEEKQLAKRCYLASITELDEYFGQVTDYLKENQLYDNTIILFTTDHGDHLGSRGLFCKNFCASEQVYNIPLIIKGCGHRKNVVSNARVGLSDVCQTVLELTGCETFDVPDSRSFMSCMTDPGQYDKEFTTGYAEYFGTRFLLTQRIVYKDSYKLVFNGFDDDELYDLEEDPGEMNNLVHNDQYAEIYEELIRLMWSYVKKTGDHTLENIHYPILRLPKYGPEL